MIRHTVMFTLIHEPDSDAEKIFLEEALVLATIPVVEKFERLRQCSNKCEHHFGFSMEFNNEQDYQIYNEHPAHQTFVKERWVVEVDSFQEIDYVEYS